MFQWLRDLFVPSAKVQDALDGSAARRTESEQFLARIEHDAEPLHQALRDNGFAPAVYAIFQRRHA